MSNLNKFFDAYKSLDAEAERKNREFQEKLGKPAFFIPDPEANDKRFGTGFWKAEGGVVSYRRFANGYSFHSRMQYSDELINALNEVRNAQETNQPAAHERQDPHSCGPHGSTNLP